MEVIIFGNGTVNTNWIPCDPLGNCAFEFFCGCYQVCACYGLCGCEGVCYYHDTCIAKNGS